jgi:hypothetical protein
MGTVLVLGEHRRCDLAFEGAERRLVYIEASRMHTLTRAPTAQAPHHGKVDTKAHCLVAPLCRASVCMSYLRKEAI